MCTDWYLQCIHFFKAYFSRYPSLTHIVSLISSQTDDCYYLFISLSVSPTAQSLLQADPSLFLFFYILLLGYCLKIPSQVIRFQKKKQHKEEKERRVDFSPCLLKYAFRSLGCECPTDYRGFLARVHKGTKEHY